MRVALFSYEFDAASVFSGNGVLARSHARGLAAMGHALLVVTAAPVADGDDETPSTTATADPDTGARVLAVPVPASAWRRLDSRSAWRAFRDGAAASAATVRAFDPAVVLAVDWHGAAAAEAMVGADVPTLYANFRVHARTDGDTAPHEAAAMRACTRAVALCAADASDLVKLMGEAAPPPPLRVLLPPLRSDVAALPRSATPRRRHLLTCCVRLSPEKEAHRFGDLVAALAASGELSRLNITPCLVGDGPDPAYVAAVRAAVRAAAPHARVVERFLAPGELAAVFDETALNCHPCLADAYGMTAVEAAARGAPTVLHWPPGTAADGSATVGVTALLRPDLGRAVGVDLGAAPAEAAATVAAALADRSRLATVAAAAEAAARGHDEAAAARQLAGELAAAAADAGRGKENAARVEEKDG